jgi:hypothetical protein
LLRAVLPRHIEANITHEKPYLTEAEILAVIVGYPFKVAL